MPNNWVGQREGGAPLAGAGLGGQLGDAFLLVVPGLGDGGVGLVRARRAHALVLEVDLGGSAEGLLPSSAPGAGEWAATACRSPGPHRGSRSWRSVDISCMMRPIGNSGARSSGPAGWSVPGWRGGGGGAGRSAATLYHAVGILSSGSKYLIGMPFCLSILVGAYKHAK